MEPISIVSVDYSDVAALAATFEEHKIDVVISTVGMQALSQQTSIGDAAKQAGVQLFLPSEFGANTIGVTDGILSPKHYFAEHLKSIGLPSVRIFVSVVVSCKTYCLLTFSCLQEWTLDHLYPVGVGP